ncbi:permease of ferrichrome ABC transporter [Klebsiella pneumoniae]|uniref:Permease of ferrichrome ABC transporter n=1 Tax=Klebsiella pneumoniae TaxID=573 RepID=A0A4P0Y4F6_KLEPN|nr:permease of ferrichrome ABC transporter [Klebsiella pneumoniae]
MIWLAGSLQAATWPLLAVAFCWALPGAIILFCTARAADVALLGDRTAIGLGVRLQQLTVLRFFAPVLLTSASVSCVGSLGFVGLMAPHMARFVLRGGQVSLLCGSALIGPCWCWRPIPLAGWRLPRCRSRRGLSLPWWAARLRCLALASP